MSDQILTQEEVGALLSAMDKGEVALEGNRDKKTDRKVETYDLTSQRIMLRDQFGALDEVYDRFKTSFQKSLSSTLNTQIEIDLLSSDLTKFGQFLKAFGTPTSFNMFTMEPLIGTALLTIRPSLAFSIIDCMLGGTGKSLDQVREFTQLEHRMIRKFAQRVLSDFELSWQCVCSLKCSLKRTETKPDFLHLFHPNDSVIVVAFSITGDEFLDNLYVSMSPLMLEPIKESISSRYQKDTELESSWCHQLQQLLTRPEVKISAILGKTTAHTVGDLLNFTSGDIIRLNTGPQDTVMLTVQDIPKYLGFPGALKGNRAVQITDLIHADGGTAKHG
ncbi:MAG: flagellar motor switch protein FliM [Thermodesulfobacteriota bacterium]|nr:flagellar motor switch protein FliM [Thermodesulfobacteriota bacterium]